jgi:glycosyltransferase involved in cell wall biosynthesis
MSPGIEPTASPQNFCTTIGPTAAESVFVAAPARADSDAREPAVGSASPATAADPTLSWCPTRDTDTRTIRVLHVVNGEHFAGAERVQSHLGRCLPKYGVRADFACVKPGRFADCVDAAEAKWGVAHRVPMRNRFDLGIARRVAQLARVGEYDLLHAHTPRTALITSIAATICRLPWVYHVHSPASRDSSKPLVNSINAWIERRSLAKCDHLITVSESLRNDCIESGYHPTRVTVVHNGVPAICYDRPATPKPGGRWVLGMVALMRPRKGLEVAIDAVSSLRQKGHDVVLRCIGPYETDAYRGEIDRRVERLGLGDRIEQVGFQADVPLALSHVDAMLLPSLYGEGLPMVVLEAMAAGLPVVATSVEGTPEAIRDGIDGLLAEPGSASSLAEKIERLFTGQVDWNSLSTESRKRHADAFSDWSMSRGVSQVYNLVLTEDR